MSKVPKIRSWEYFCNILRKNIDEVYFLCADKHESVLQVDTKILGVFGQTKFYTCNKIF